jgi:hypothetical protein
MKFHENTFSGSRVIPYECADIMKLIAAFRNFANASDKMARKRGIVGFCTDVSTTAFFVKCLYEILR